ncbi:MAG: cytosine-specific methylase, partial [Flaviaesturariibacter sp.]|nr:cytosine-specific methylase [Flaviaesturariibacter sp.]
RPSEPIPHPTAAEVLGWPEGEFMRTRNNRRPTGGNLFSTDGPSWCLTGKARSWMRDSDGLRLDVGPCGALQGFPVDYPWQGSRTSQFQQAGDVVSPLVGAAVLGAALGIEWEPQVRARSLSLAPGRTLPEPDLTPLVAEQLALVW